MIYIPGFRPLRIVAGVAFVGFSPSVATAQPYPRDVVAHCARIADHYPAHHCTQCDIFLYDIELACQANGGRLPGSLTIFGNRPYDEGPTWKDKTAQ